MKKEEAIKAMSEGKKVRHRHFNFSSDEWMMQLPNGDYQFEDGVIIGAHCAQEDFWKYRQDESWSTDWEIVK